MHVNIILPLVCATAVLMDEGLLSIILAGSGQLVTMLITLEMHELFGSNFEYLSILTLSSHWYAKCWRGLAKHHFSQARYFSENAA